jgi:putative PIN family toxin of toxin-antitoxin system
MPSVTRVAEAGALRLVIDTNLWLRALLGGGATLPLLQAWRAGRFVVVISEALLAELDAVWQRPRLRPHIVADDARDLLDQLRQRSILVAVTTIPPRCRDPRDQPVLATAIDGAAHAIVSGDADLRADDELRAAMRHYGVEIWGMSTLLERIDWSRDPS